MNYIKKQIFKTLPLTWIKFVFVFILYLLFIIWDHNYWLLIGYPIIVDVFILKIIPWEIWKKINNKKLKKIAEWGDAIIFSLLAVYFIHTFTFQHYKIPTASLEKTLLVGDYILVSKLSYGPRIPNTPLSFPITHNTLPILNVKSYFDYPHWKYKRLKGLGSIKRGDIVVFNCPVDDTITSNCQNQNYYDLIYEYGWNKIHTEQNKYGKIISRPVDKRENYVKRCIGLPGDLLQIIEDTVYINGNISPFPPKAQFNFFVETNGDFFSEKQFRELDVNKIDQLLCNPYYITSFLKNIKSDQNGNYNPIYDIPLTQKSFNILKRHKWSRHIYKEPYFLRGNNMYPYGYKTGWTRENFGPIWIPKKGMTIPLNKNNLELYKRCIINYENNTLKQKGNQILINNVPTHQYTFQYDYYFMMGDNRHNSFDSRMWGFVPEDHIVGKSLFILLSFDKERTWTDGKIRWGRFFKSIK